MWDQLKCSDIERAKQALDLAGAKQALATRRAEILARHAEELKGLEADETLVDSLEQAIGAFAQKFAQPADVVNLDDQRESRQSDAS